MKSNFIHNNAKYEVAAELIIHKHQLQGFVIPPNNVLSGVPKHTLVHMLTGNRN